MAEEKKSDTLPSGLSTAFGASGKKEARDISPDAKQMRGSEFEILRSYQGANRPDNAAAPIVSRKP